MEEGPWQRPVPRLEPVNIGRLTVYQIASTFQRQNCYIVTEKESATAVVIDPGYGACAAVDKLLDETGCTLSYIVLTHGHIDHIANLNELRACRPCKVVATPETSDMLPFPKKNLSAFHSVPPYTAERADVLISKKCDNLPWGSEKIILHLSPGHTAGCLTIEMPRMLFTGDTLIKDAKTVVKLPSGDRASLRESLAWIFAFPEDTRIFAGHGDSFYLRDVTPQFSLGQA